MKKVRLILVNRHGNQTDLGLMTRHDIHDGFGQQTRVRLERAWQVMEENPGVPRVRVAFAGVPAAFTNPGNKSCYIMEREVFDVRF